LRTAILIGAIVVLLGVVGGRCWKLSVDEGRAAREREALRERLRTTLDPIVFLGTRLKERLEAGEVMTAEEVERFIEGYTKQKVVESERRYYYFIVDVPLAGKACASITARYSDDGQLVDISWESTDHLAR